MINFLKKYNTYKLIELAIFFSMAIVFQLLTSFEIVPIYLCLVPITLGAMLLGIEGGVILGVSFGLLEFFLGVLGKGAFIPAFIASNKGAWFVVFLICMFKCVGAGVIPALVYKSLKRANRYLAVMISTILAPIVNTGLFLLGIPFFTRPLEQMAEVKGQPLMQFILMAIIVSGFVPEMLINVLLAPTLVRLVVLLEKKYKAKKRRAKPNAKYATVFFDLDGTVVDSGEGVTNSVVYALAKFGIDEIPANTKRFIGPPLASSFKDFYGFNDEKTEQAIKYYREYYKEKGIYECFAYEGIEDLLSSLKEGGYELVLCTSKPEEYAKIVLGYVHLDKYFNHICGATMDEKTRATKEDVMHYALMKTKSTNHDTVMVGDRRYDICSANRFGLNSIGVTFGYGTRQELEKAGATYVVNAPSDIKNLLI